MFKGLRTTVSTKLHQIILLQAVEKMYNGLTELINMEKELEEKHQAEEAAAPEEQPEPPPDHVHEEAGAPEDHHEE